MTRWPACRAALSARMSEDSVALLCQRLTFEFVAMRRRFGYGESFRSMSGRCGAGGHPEKKADWLWISSSQPVTTQQTGSGYLLHSQ